MICWWSRSPPLKIFLPLTDSLFTGCPNDFRCALAQESGTLFLLRLIARRVRGLAFIMVSMLSSYLFRDFSARRVRNKLSPLNYIDERAQGFVAMVAVNTFTSSPILFTRVSCTSWCRWHKRRIPKSMASLSKNISFRGAIWRFCLRPPWSSAEAKMHARPATSFSTSRRRRSPQKSMIYRRSIRCATFGHLHLFCRVASAVWLYFDFAAKPDNTSPDRLMRGYVVLNVYIEEENRLRYALDMPLLGKVVSEI